VAPSRSATFAFGSILEGPDPDKLAPVAAQALPFLLNALNDPKTHVRDTTAWTIGRVFEFVGEAQSPVVNPGNLDGILKTLVEKLQDKPLVAGKVCYALLRLATSCANEDEQNPMRLALAPYFQGIVQSLLQTSERPDAEQSLRMECYESLNEIIRASTQQNAPIVDQLTPMVLQKLEATLAAFAQPGAPRLRRRSARSRVCSAEPSRPSSRSSPERRHQDDDPAVQRSDHADAPARARREVRHTVHEEAMLCVGALAYATGEHFEKYMQALYPFIEVGLKNHEEYEVCNVTVGVVGDLCRALDAKFCPFATASCTSSCRICSPRRCTAR
jgi:importin subunit beta-1